MKIEDVKKLFLIISNCYQNFQIDEVKLKIWHKLLQDMPYKRAERKLYKHIAGSSYIPTPADIIGSKFGNDIFELYELRDRRAALLESRTIDQDLEDEIAFLERQTGRIGRSENEEDDSDAFKRIFGKSGRSELSG